ncbi:beta-ketoacyl reductase, partial [Streptomyces umbrinus]
HVRRGEGLAGVSLAWGLWSGGAGMGAHLDTKAFLRQERVGTPAVSPERGLELFDAALARGDAALVPQPVDRATVAGNPEVPHVLRQLIRQRRQAARPRAGVEHRNGHADPDRADGRAGLAGRLRSLQPSEQLDVLLDLVRTHVAAVRHDDSVTAGADNADANRGFTELGLDSLAAVELRNALSAATGLRLPATLMYDHPNRSLLARYLHERLVPEGTGDEPAAEGTQVRSSPFKDMTVEDLVRAALGPDKQE